jgi:hypothetical protein
MPSPAAPAGGSADTGSVADTTEFVGERVPCWDTPRRIAQALDLLAHQPGGAAELTTAQSVAARPPKARAPRPRCA